MLSRILFAAVALCLLGSLPAKPAAPHLAPREPATASEPVMVSAPGR